MPVREGICRSSSCRAKGYRQEHYYHNDSQPLNPCDYCGGPTELVEFSRTHVVFTGEITARYNDAAADNPHQNGHWAWRKKSSPDGKPQAVFIDTWDKQREFCKMEGLANPKEMPRNFEIGEDGKQVLNTVGMPGCEV